TRPVPNPAGSDRAEGIEDVSNLAACTVTPGSPHCPGGACQMNGSGDSFPAGDEFEGSSRSAADQPKRENPDVNVSPSADETEETIETPQLADRFSVVTNDACTR